MATLGVNGRPVTAERNQKLLRFLRDELRLTSVKDGCSEGACGTCTVIVDGRAVKSCVLTTRRAVGKHIVTMEGLSSREQEAFVYAFGAKGAVQCGFCTPGMILAAVALLNHNPDPNEDEIRDTLRGNICRCTGYTKIIDAIMQAKEVLKQGRKAERTEEADPYVPVTVAACGSAEN